MRNIYLLDTTVIIDAINRRNKRDELIASFFQIGGMLACCPINIAEVYGGMRPDEEQRTGAFIKSLKMYQITSEVAERAGRMQYAYRKKGKTIFISDLLIASVAITNKITLVTDNIKDFPMPELQMYNMSE